MITRGGLMFFTVLLGASLGYGSNDADVIATRHAFSQWANMTLTNYPSMVHGRLYPDVTFPTNGLPVSVRLDEDDLELELSIRRGDDELFRVNTWVRPSVESAHRAIIQDLSSMSSVQSYVRMNNCVGDVAFFQNLGTNGDSVVFARNNVFVAVDSRIPSASATNIARQVDAAILRASGVQTE